jgi:hypothetical protein
MHRLTFEDEDAAETPGDARRSDPRLLLVERKLAGDGNRIGHQLLGGQSGFDEVVAEALIGLVGGRGARRLHAPSATDTGDYRGHERRDPDRHRFAHGDSF